MCFEGEGDIPVLMFRTGGELPAASYHPSLVYGCCAADMVEGFAKAALFPIEQREVVEANSNVGMPGAQRLLTNRQAALVKRLGLALAAVGFIEQRQVIEAKSNMGMLGAKHLLINRQAALIQRLGLAITALGLIE